MSLINKTQVKQFAIDCAERSGRGQFKHVSKEFLDRAEARLKTYLAGEIQRHPSLGKTLK